MLTKMIHVKSKEKEVNNKKAKESLKSNNNKRFDLMALVINMQMIFFDNSLEKIAFVCWFHVSIILVER